jgi:predicted transcriptional regulator
MKAAEWIDRLKASQGIESDYRVAQVLEVSKQTVSTYRAKQDATMDEQTSIKVARLLGVNPAGLVLDQVAERTQSPELRTTLSALAGQLCALCKVAWRSRPMAIHYA